MSVHAIKRELRIHPRVAAKVETSAAKSDNKQVQRAIRCELISTELRDSFIRHSVNKTQTAEAIGITRQSLTDIIDPEQVSDNLKVADLIELPREVVCDVLERSLNVMLCDVAEVENVETDISSLAALSDGHNEVMHSMFEGLRDGHLSNPERAKAATEMREQARLLWTLANRLEGK